MDKKNIIAEKTINYAVKTVKLYQKLIEEKRQFDLGRQLLKSGTSIGANVEEAIGGYTRKDFAAKMSIAYKELRETIYWIRLLRETELISAEEFTDMENDGKEIGRILYKIIETSRKDFA